ncbi:DUF1643 domain-containing protein [Stutzerimonas xanthomarina]|uniref:DUF1643 domain-containing protein n=1 Tax=Stutzerimonas xanthomarina TaxID=271420 RepID=UPI00093455C5|nr:DUF1643 domain-containing protein [Stutzerimonas xanthomarina]MCP9340480.1 DUF1643 domain-containing protein [Stutzerimonas xanthomarina]
MVFKHINGVVAEAQFSPCGRYRYRLTIDREDSMGDRSVSVIMQNPSVANSEVADRSVQFLENLIFNKDYDEFNGVKRIIVVNQFALIQTNDFEGVDDHIGIENDRHIENALNESDIVLIAWGAGNPYLERQKAITSMLTQHCGKRLLKTKKHPSRGSYKDFVEPLHI